MNFNFALLHAGISRVETDYQFNDVCSNFSRIMLVREGHGVIFAGNERHELRPGRVYFIPPLLTHSIQCSGPSQCYYVMFNDLSMNIYDHFHTHRYNLEIPSTEGLELIFSQIARMVPEFELEDIAPVSYDSPHKTIQRIKAFRNLPAPDQMALNGLLHVILSQFMDKDAPAASVNDIRISKAMWTINRDLTQIPSLDELSAKACLNKNTFIRLFRQQTGFTPTDYIIRRRVLRAQLLFVSGNRSVKDVAYQVGYDNVSYFGRTFKRIVGISPQHFINQNK